jgi:hypothetical protein
MSVNREVRWFRSARRHRVGKAHAMHVISTTPPVRIAATEDLEARLVWIGEDAAGSSSRSWRWIFPRRSW